MLSSRSRRVLSIVDSSSKSFPQLEQRRTLKLDRDLVTLKYFLKGPPKKDEPQQQLPTAKTLAQLGDITQAEIDAKYGNIKSSPTLTLEQFMEMGRKKIKRSYNQNYGAVNVYSWGEGAHGQLATGADASVNTPTKIATLNQKPISGLSAGLTHASATTKFGAGLTWGGNFHMQVGHDHSGKDVFMVFDDRELNPGDLGPYLPLAKEDKLTTLVKQISCGAFHSLLLLDKRDELTEVYSWGSNTYGQLGLEKVLGNQQFPVKVPFAAGEQIKMVSAGTNHSAAVTTDGLLWVWGQNEQHQLGLEDSMPCRSPYPMRKGLFSKFKVSQAACGAYHTVILTTDGDVYVCGKGRINPELPLHMQHDPYYIRAEEEMPNPSAAGPHLVLQGQKVTQIVAGNGLSAALTGKGEMYIWGQGEEPRKVEQLEGKKIVKISLSWTHAAAITESGGLYVWAVAPLNLTRNVNLTEEDDEDSLLEMQDFTTEQTIQQQSYKDIDPKIRLPSYRGARGPPKPGTIKTPLHLTAVPSTTATPKRIAQLAKEKVLDVALGWNFAFATTVPRPTAPSPRWAFIKQLPPKQA